LWPRTVIKVKTKLDHRMRMTGCFEARNTQVEILYTAVTQIQVIILKYLLIRKPYQSIKHLQH